jgi:hypothetical protein
MGLKATDRILDFMKEGKVYRRQSLEGLSNNLARDLNKLVEKEELIKAAPSLYYKPEMTQFGSRPASVNELVSAFLNEGDFLITSFNDYNALGLGLTQLYNNTIVYNRKRHGEFILDGRPFSFRRPRNFPKEASKEFLFVDVLNNRNELAEDTTNLESLVAENAMKGSKKTLLENANYYGKVYTKKFFRELLTT